MMVSLSPYELIGPLGRAHCAWGAPAAATAGIIANLYSSSIKTICDCADPTFPNSHFNSLSAWDKVQGAQLDFAHPTAYSFLASMGLPGSVAQIDAAYCVNKACPSASATQCRYDTYLNAQNPNAINITAAGRDLYAFAQMISAVCTVINTNRPRVARCQQVCAAPVASTVCKGACPPVTVDCGPNCYFANAACFVDCNTVMNIYDGTDPTAVICVGDTTINGDLNGRVCGAPDRGRFDPVQKACVCADGFTGVACQETMCTYRKGALCGGEGTCDRVSNRCMCNPGWFGNGCEFFTDDPA